MEKEWNSMVVFSLILIGYAVLLWALLHFRYHVWVKITFVIFASLGAGFFFFLVNPYGMYGLAIIIDDADLVTLIWVEGLLLFMPLCTLAAVIMGIRKALKKLDNF